MSRLADLPEDQRVFAVKSLLALISFLLVPLVVVAWMFDFDPSQVPLRTFALLMVLVGFPGWVAIVAWRAVVKFRN